MPRQRKPDPIKYCQSCGKQLHRKRFVSGTLEDFTVFGKRKFCDMKCMGKGCQGRYKTVVLPAEGRYRARTIRKKVACELCGTDRRRLDVHHRDENPLNNDPKNLQVVCRSCHMKIHRPQKLCVVCGEPQRGYGYCEKHLLRLRKYGDPNFVKTLLPRKKCQICGELANARELCGKHYMQAKRSGQLS